MFEAISKRVSVRAYAPKPVPRDVLEKIADAGRLAPTGRGEEPWEFVAVTDKGSLKELGRLADSGRFLAGAGAAVAVFCRQAKYYIEDGSAATQNMLLAATALGVASCWVAGDKKPYVGEVTKLLGVPPDFKLVSLISIGWPKEKIKQSKNRSLDEVLHWEKF